MSELVEHKIPKYFTKEYFKDVLEYGFREINLEVTDLQMEKLSLGGENYCSNIYRARITFKNTKKDKICEKILIIKSMPKDKQAALSALQIYLKETVFYLDIKPKFETLMWNAPGKEKWIIGARHLQSLTIPEETIIFEDLSVENYKLQSRQIGLDFEHSKLALQKLAEFHALSMLMARMEPSTIIERYPFGLLNMGIIKAPSFKELTGAQLLKLAELIEKREGYQEIAVKLRNYYQNFEEKLLSAVFPMKGALNVLNHGDMWINNLFFKNDDSGKPKEVQFIDFQLCYHGSPGFDINYFLTTSVQLEVLKSQRQLLIQHYFDALLLTLEFLQYGHKLPTFEMLQNEIRSREAYGVFVAIAFFPLMSMANVESQDVSLENLHDAEFISRKVELMFLSNPRTFDSLLYFLQRADGFGILD